MNSIGAVDQNEMATVTVQNVPRGCCLYSKIVVVKIQNLLKTGCEHYMLNHSQ